MATGGTCGRRARWLAALAGAALVASAAVAAGVPPSVAGAGTAPPFPATGYFSTGTLDGRSFLVTPTGEPFYSSGIDHVTPSGTVTQVSGTCPYCEAVATQYGSTTAWVTATVTRLRSWGFNSLGPFSNVGLLGSKLPFSVQLTMGRGQDDYFSTTFVTHADQIAASQVAPLATDPNLIGWYTDSELRWGPDGTSFNPLLDTYLALPTTSPGHTVAEEYAGNPDGFLSALATRYFQVTTDAVRMYDPHHLILGVKATSQEIQPQLLEAASKYVDVFSVDDYQLQPGLAQIIDKIFPEYLPVTATFASFEPYLHKPMMVAEYSFIAHTAKTPDTVPGLYAVYPTQQARAAAYTNYVEPKYVASPYVVGDEWFELVDEPQGGRFDGENDNFGVVTVTNQPYEDLVTQMQEMHAIAPDRAARPGPSCDSWAVVTGTTTCTATVSWPTYPLKVFTTALPTATTGTAYANYVVAEGGRPGYTFSVPATQSLPPGLTLDPSTGLVSGTPDAGGDYSFTVDVTDATTPTPETASATVAITVLTPLAVAATALPPATVGSPYSASVEATGGTAPYTWSASGLPAGLGMSPTGTVSGTPTAAGDATVRVTVTDSTSPTAGTASADLPLAVLLPSSLAVTATPLTAAAGATVTFGAMVSGSGGTPTGTVAFSVGPTAACTATLSGGSGSCTTAVTATGDLTVRGTYSGDGTYASSTATTTLTVGPATPANGYWEAGSDGGIFAFGDAAFYGSMGGRALNAPIVGMAATPDGKGYWEVASDGGIFAFGDAAFYGSMGGRALDQPIVGMAATPDGQGYWEVASDGGIFAFGDAAFYGSMGGRALQAPVAGIAAAPTGGGYWEVASDGGIFAFGDAAFYGSMGGRALQAPVAGIAAAPTGGGYWEVASDGGIFAFGDAAFYGSMGGRALHAPVAGIAAAPTGGGYWEVASDGGIFAFGDAAFYGSMGGRALQAPVVTMAASPA